MEIRPVAAQLFNADGQMDDQIRLDETNSRFSQLCERI